MGNVLKREKREQICALGRLGWSLRRIEEATRVRRETVSRYLRRAGIEVREPRGRRLRSNAASQPTADPGPLPGAVDPVPGHGEGSKAASQATPDLERGPEPGWSPVASRCEPYRASIEEQLERRRNAKGIWQELVDRHGFEGSYECVKRFVRKLRGPRRREAHPRIETAPGEEAQVDYGDGPMVRDGSSGKYRRTRLFAMTLGFSRKSVWLLTFQSSSRRWCELHEEAFRRTGGVCGAVVLDNLKEGVLAPDIYDPELNPLYRALLDHYGVVALPARRNHPDRKGKVERAVGHAQSTPLKGMRFETLEEAQAYLDHWSARWADTRIHGTTKRQVAAMFAEERSALKPLPLEPFRYFRHGTRSVHLDGCVEVDASYYAAPRGWIGRLVAVQWDGIRVRLLDPESGKLLREHVRKPRGHRSVHPEDRPAKTPPTTLSLLARARGAGKAVGATCAAIHESRGEAGVRSILGLLALVKKHGPEPVERACAVALETGVPTYRFVKKWIEHHPPVPITLRQVDPLIRQLQQYRDRIDQMTQSSNTTS